MLRWEFSTTVSDPYSRAFSDTQASAAARSARSSLKLRCGSCMAPVQMWHREISRIHTGVCGGQIGSFLSQIALRLVHGAPTNAAHDMFRTFSDTQATVPPTTALDCRWCGRYICSLLDATQSSQRCLDVRASQRDGECNGECKKRRRPWHRPSCRTHETIVCDARRVGDTEVERPYLVLKRRSLAQRTALSSAGFLCAKQGCGL